MSNEVKRYWHAPKIGFIELDPDQYDEESGYVTYDDYATLEAECERWKERCQYNADTAHAVATERDALHTQLEAIRAAGGEQVEVCDGKEQEAFEEFAKGQKMDMAVHPMHWLFLNKETYAARQGWKAAIRYCRALLATPSMEVKS